MKLWNIILLNLLIILVGCGGSSDNNDSEPPLTGIFIDSAVKGMNYKTDTQSGVTDENGTIKYIAGEKVTLSIGGIDLPQFDANEIMSPLDVFQTDDLLNNKVQNLSILLQSLDLDSNLENGIEIPTSVADSSLTSIDFDQDTTSFRSDDGVMNFVTSSVVNSQGLVTAVDASQHFQKTLIDNGKLTASDAKKYTDLVIGNTTTFGDSSYYYSEDGKRYTNQGGGITVTSWSIDSTGAICEVTLTRGEICVSQEPEFLVTGNGPFLYNAPFFVGSFTIMEGDALNLSQ